MIEQNIMQTNKTNLLLRWLHFYRGKSVLLFLVCFLLLSQHNAFAGPTEEAPVASNVVTNTIIVLGRQPIIAPIAYDANGPVSSYTLVSVPTSGTLHIGSSGGVLTAGTTLTTEQAANLYYTPPSILNLGILMLIEGTYTFSFTATDNTGKTSNNATYSIPVGESYTPNVPTPASVVSLYMPSSAGQTAIPALKATGGTIDGYRITSLPRSTDGVLYTSSTATGTRTAITELTSEGYYHLTLEQADNLWFDPEPTFEGKASFTYTASNTKSTSYSENTAYSVPTYSDAEINLLPVELTSFQATLTTFDAVRLSWETATEQNSDYFSIERSTDGRKFEAIGQVKGKGYSMILQSYSFVDAAPDNGTSYYRLRQVDKDDTYAYSAVVAARVTTKTKESKLLAYPNPTAADLTLRIETAQAEAVLVEVLDLQGKALVQKTINLEAGSNNVVLRLDELSSGVYLAEVKGQEIRLTERILKKQ
jgi:hypothetical protein